MYLSLVEFEGAAPDVVVPFPPPPTWPKAGKKLPNRLNAVNE
jgi:hypothetical protein